MDRDKVTRLLEYIRTFPELLIYHPESSNTGYDHMGAVLTDAMLQAGLRYETTVRPRVNKVLAITEAVNTSGFLNILDREGAAEVLNWRDPEKPNRLLGVARFFQSQGIETVEALRTWLIEDENIARLKEQRGVGNKTADYFKILVGLPATAIDRHLYKFLENAGCPAKDYAEAQALLQAAADDLGIPLQVLDHNVWVLMS